MLLGRSQGDPGDGDLDGREDDHPAPPRQHRPHVDARECDRQQDGGSEHRPREHERRRRDLGDDDPDEQVRDAPDDRHQGEQDEPASGHPAIG